MSIKILTITFLKLLLIQNVLSFLSFEPNKEYNFKIEWEDKAIITPIGRKLTRFFHSDMTVRKSDDDHLLILFKNVNIDGHDTSPDFPEPFKIKVVDHEIVSLVTTGNWTKNDIKFEYNVLEEFVKDYSNITRLLNSDNWKDDRAIELPLGECLAEIKINLHKTEVTVMAVGSKLNCNLTDDIVSSVPAFVDLDRSLSDDSDGGIKIILDRASMEFKEIEVFADLEIYLDVRKSRYSVKTRLSYEYVGFNEVSNEVPFEDQVVHSIEELSKHGKKK